MPQKKVDDEAAVLAKITEMTPHQAMAKRIHEVIMETAPELKARLWYGMPGYAKTKSGPVICFFRLDDYMTFGLTEKANLTPDEGAPDHLIPSSWFLTELDAPTESRIAAIVKKASS